MQAFGNQGKSIVRIKINFCKKNLLKIDPYFQCFSSILKDCETQFAPNLNHSLFIISSQNHETIVQLLTTMKFSWSSFLFWEATAILIDLVQLGFPYHTIYAGPSFGLTYINLHLDPSKRELVYATREHSTPPPCAAPGGFTGCVYATLTISHAQCTVVFPHNGIAEVSGLPEYVASTTSHDHKRPYNDRSSIDTDGASTTRQTCWLNHQRHNPCPAQSPV